MSVDKWHHVPKHGDICNVDGHLFQRITCTSSQILFSALAGESSVRPLSFWSQCQLDYYSNTLGHTVRVKQNDLEIKHSLNSIFVSFVVHKL